MLLHTIYLVAIVAEAMSGAIMGMRRNMDIFGICLIGSVTALGGGSIRDVLLGHYPLGWIAHPEYLAFTAGAAVAGAMCARLMHHLRAVFLIVDGLGLVTFTVIGCDVAIAAGVHVSTAIMSGMITGVFGGLLRDVLCNEIPLVLRHELYASVSLLTGVLYMGLLWLQIDSSVASGVAIATGLLFRLLSLRFSWTAPRFNAEGMKDHF